MWSEEQYYYLSEDTQDGEGSWAFCCVCCAALPLLSHTQVTWALEGTSKISPFTLTIIRAQKE